jgi:mannose-1-phosphate guanylyltransferase
MVPVLNQPLLEYVLRRLHACAIKQVVLALSHLAPAIEDYFGNGGAWGMDIKYVLEDSRLGTAGAARNARGYIDDACLVMNGDIFTDINITAMLEFHRARGARATIALTPVDNPSAYGLVETEEDGRIKRFLEKPSPEQITTNMINAGLYIIEPEVLAAIPENTVVSFEKEVFPSLLAEHQPFYGFAGHNSYWIDIGTPAKYHRLNRDLLFSRTADVGAAVSDVVMGAGCDIAPDARISGPAMLGDGCFVGQGAVIKGPVVMGPGCRIETGAVVDDSVIWHHVTVGRDSSVVSSVIADDSLLNGGCRLKNCVIGDHITLPEGYYDENAQVWPDGQRRDNPAP